MAPLLTGRLLQRYSEVPDTMLLPEEKISPSAVGVHHGASSILLVDDDESVVTVIKRVLEPKGFQVDAASEGKQALRMFEADPYDLVITDIMMPGMGGWELISILHARWP